MLNFLTSLPAIIGGAMFLSVSESLTPFRSSLSFFVAGLSGIIIVIRKESPTSVFTIRGNFAVLEGVVFTIVCWGLSVYFWLAH